MQCDHRQGSVTNGSVSVRDRNDQRQARADSRAAQQQGGAGGVRGRLAKPVSKKTFNSEVRIKAAISVLRKRSKSQNFKRKLGAKCQGLRAEPKAGHGVPLLKAGALWVGHQAFSCPEVPAVGPNCLLRAYFN